MPPTGGWSDVGQIAPSTDRLVHHRFDRRRARPATPPPANGFHLPALGASPQWYAEAERFLDRFELFAAEVA
jgi:hypothetical protein